MNNGDDRMHKVMLDKLNQIYEDFKNNIEDKLCDLKCFKFTSDNIPDYNNPNIQRYYLLRFMLGYFCEYYLIYSDIMDLNFLKNDYNILSIGCGCGIDFWGLKMAKQMEETNVSINYTGIDIVEWLYRDSCGENNVSFINKDIQELYSLDKNNYNIIIFPKSIGEFDERTFVNLKESIEHTNFTQNKLVLISSLRNSKSDSDIDRMVEIVNVFEDKHKYKSQNNPNRYTYIEKKGNGYPYRLYDIIDDFIYPIEINNYMIKLYSECQGYKENNNKCCENDCKKVLGRYPITTMSQVKYQIITLERK